MLKKINKLQSVFISPHRLLTTTSINLDNDLQEAKPFKSIPSLSAFQLLARNMPGGKYYKNSLDQLHQSVRAEYGNIVKFPSILGMPSMVIAYDANDFEKVVIRFDIKKNI